MQQIYLNYVLGFCFFLFYDFLCIQIILGLKAAKIMAALIDACADKRSCSFISYNSTC